MLPAGDESVQSALCLQVGCTYADAHSGYGMPIGGVIAAEDVIIPNAVGVDIGCGIAYVETNISKDELSREGYERLVNRIMRRIPTGFAHHKRKQESQVLIRRLNLCFMKKDNKLVDEIDAGYYQIGTLGGGIISLNCRKMKKASCV